MLALGQEPYISELLSSSVRMGQCPRWLDGWIDVGEQGVGVDTKSSR
jgi:hypothetical protein